MARLLQRKPNAVFGLVTGSTPLMLYSELIRLHREEGLNFSNVVTFSLDEYVGTPKEHSQSYHAFMWENLFCHINIKPENLLVRSCTRIKTLSKQTSEPADEPS